MSQTAVVLWLKAAIAAVVAFGLMMALAASFSLSAPTAWLLDLVFYPLDANPTMAAPELRLLSAISGGLLVGWGAALWLIVTRLLPRDPALARQMILVSLWSWFVVDSTGSVVSGGHWNAVANLGFLLAFLIPTLQLPAEKAESAQAGHGSSTREAQRMV